MGNNLFFIFFWEYSENILNGLGDGRQVNVQIDFGVLDTWPLLVARVNPMKFQSRSQCECEYSKGLGQLRRQYQTTEN